MDTCIAMASSFGTFGIHPNNTSTHDNTSVSTNAPTTTSTTTTVSTPTIPSTIQQQRGHQPILHPLTPIQEAPLARGSNFVVVIPKYPQGNIHYNYGGGLYKTFPRVAEELRAVTYLLWNWEYIIKKMVDFQNTSQIFKKNCPHPNLTSVRKKPGPSRNSRKTNPGWY